MIRFFPVAALVAAGLAVAGAADAFSLPFRHPAARPAAAAAPVLLPHPGQWPQAFSDLPPDPEVRFGTLANGMRYAIVHNATPPGQASVRLRIGAGSMMESDDQQGLAHFLEHMAFDGSKSVPNGEMVKILERHGLSFGADTNAQTGFDNTLYKLDLPKTDDDTLDTALMLLREAAGNLTLAQDAIDKERGVVLSEERTRDSPAYRIFEARLGFLMEGQRPPQRYPIGKVAVISAAQRAQIADFYDRYYRPDRASLIVVGDFDAAAMEAKIHKLFDDWRGVGPAGADPDVGQVEHRGLQTRLAVEPGAPTSIQLAWMTPPDRSVDSVAKRRRQEIERLGLAVLNRRLASLARADDPPFIAAGALRGEQLHAARMTAILVTAEADKWRTALTVAQDEERRAAAYGVRPEELAREIDEEEAALKQSVAQAATRRTPDRADELAGSIDADEVETSPAEDLALFEAAVKGLTAAEVSQALKAVFEGAGPLIFVSSPVPIDGGEAAIAAAYEAGGAKPVAAPTALTERTWPYGDFGDPGKLADQREVGDLDAVFVRFDNGVRLTVKPTKFRDDQVLVKVRFGAGMRSLAPDTQNMSWAGYAFLEGGLKKITADDAERVLASRVYGADYRIEDDAFVLAGATRRDDLDAQLEVLAAYATDPGWRPEAFERVRTYAATLLDQYAHTDSGVLGRDLAGLLHAGDRRWTYPDRDQISDASFAELQRQMAPVQTGPIEVIVVGDITPDKAIEAVARTFGALPPRAPTPPPADPPAVGFPAPHGAPVVLTHSGRADQAIAFVAWRTNDFFADPQGARDVSILGEVLELRLLDTLRTGEAVSYAPHAAYDASFTWPGWGYISASVEAPPAKMAEVFAAVSKISADLRDHEIGADELERAKKPRIDTLEKARQTNEYWLAALSGAQADPRRLTAIRSEIAGVERVTAADVRDAARKYLRDDAAWRLEVKPAGI
jgi:zinc protease